MPDRPPAGSDYEAFVVNYVRHGMTPFFGLPLAEVSDPAKAYAGKRLVLLGVAYDGGTSQYQGARYAPYSVRTQSINALTVEGLVALAAGGAVDGGNIPVPMRSPEAMRATVEKEIGAVLGAGAVPFVVGGDHSVGLPILRAVAKQLGPVAVVHVDAHPDTSHGERFLTGDEYHHGTPLRHALEEGLVARGQLHQIGVRVGFDADLARAHAVNVYGMDELSDRGVPDVMARVRDAIGSLPTYLTFDIDAVDPAFAPGTGTPSPGGLTSREALRIVRLLRGLRLVGMDVVEVLPARDHADITSLLAASLILEGIVALGPARR